MPKFPKGFGRRKSTANALEDLQNAPVSGESSFRVLDRPIQGHNKNSSFDGGIKLAKDLGRPTSSPMQRIEDNMFAGINRDRDSGGSNSNTTSTFTTDNSSRFSAASSAPSTHNSVEYHHQDERVSHPERHYDIPTQKLPRPPSTFSLRAAGRTISFGRGKGTPPHVKEETLPPPPPIIEYQTFGAGRSGGATPSSFASTATPPKLEEDLGLNLGEDDFSSDMFANYKRKNIVMQPNQERNVSAQDFGRDASEPAKPLPAYSNQRPNQPPPLTIDRSRNIEPSPYSWSSSHDSGRGPMGVSPSPPPVAHMNAPAVPPHGVPYESNGDNFTSHARPQRPGGPIDSGLRRSSAFSAKRRSTLDMSEPIDEDANLLRESVNAARQLSTSPTRRENGHRSESPEETAKQPLQRIPSASSHTGSDDMFDPTIAEHAVLANRLTEQALSPPPSRLPRNKIMTPAQFERAKQDHERAVLSGVLSSKDDEEEDAYDEDEEEAERLKKIAKQRKMQDAHMAVFRQGMMKSTGETASPLPPRPNIMSSFSTPNLTLGGKSIDDDSDEDEEIPLAILQAHGFPNKNRQPSHLASLSSSNLQIGALPGPASNSGSGAGGGGGNLPPFARNLPQDPYFGASVVNPLNRELPTFGNGSGSSRGGGIRPQGLVGVIANEERARAMRRGSPSAATADFASNGMHHTGFGAMGMGIPPNMNMQMHQPMMNPMGPMGPMMMNPMMAQQMMPAPNQTPQDQMDFMRMQMQMQQMQQMQFMQMMNGGGLAPPGSANGQQRTSTMTGMGAPTLNIPGIGSTPQRPQSSGRAMSMMDPNAAPWSNLMPNYTPSIAPSERSNVGLPGRYRPVSQAGGVENNININKSRTPSPSNLGTQNRWSNGTTTKGPSSLATAATIKPSVRAVERDDDEDDEEGWKAMKAKREKKKGFWKEKKADDEIKGMLGHFD